MIVLMIQVVTGTQKQRRLISSVYTLWRNAGLTRKENKKKKNKIERPYTITYQLEKYNVKKNSIDKKFDGDPLSKKKKNIIGICDPGQ